MKYMGSKQLMLQNGLGEMIVDQAKNLNRVVDLFCGAGFISQFAAQNTNCSVLAVDLQLYATTLAGSVIERTSPINTEVLIEQWIKHSLNRYRRSALLTEWNELSKTYLYSIDKIKKSCNDRPNRLLKQKDFTDIFASMVLDARNFCSRKKNRSLILYAYGGHYFSPAQALAFDYLRKYLPQNNPERKVALAAMLTVASRCAASPGHTAQPFQPTEGGSKYLRESWQKNPFDLCAHAVLNISAQYARLRGETYTGDAVNYANNLRNTDLAILDPPYSNVQYSRFYHVLETIARGSCGDITGVGRYPPLDERPRSEFSSSAQSLSAFTKILDALSSTGATVLITFPNVECSNGMSSKDIEAIATKNFKIKNRIVKTKFSTLGGKGKAGHRASRKLTDELILLLKPR